MGRFVRLLLVTGLFVSPAFGQTREVIDRGKAATALVDLRKQKQTATAFCVEKSGVFVTNFHVVEDVEDGEEIRLVLHASTDQKKEVVATVVRKDKKNDLALLRTKKAGNFTTLSLGSDRKLFETMQLTVFGFPFGKGLAVQEDRYPAMSINTGRVTAIRREKKNGVKLVQLDADINPGNSGGPVVDKDGNVVGVVSFGLRATGVNFAIPAGKVAKLLEQPEVKIDFPKITAKSLNKESTIQVTVVPFLQEIKELAVDVSVKVGDEDSVKLTLHREKGNQFVGKFTPRPDGEDRKVLLDVEVRFPGGRLQARIEDQEIVVAGKKQRLSEIRELEFGENPGETQVELNEGPEQMGVVEGLEKVSVDFGGTVATVDLSKASHVRLSLRDQDEPQIAYTVIVRSGEREIHRIESESSSAVARLGGRRRIKPYKGEKSSIQVPGIISDVAVGYGGRMLLLLLGVQKKVAVFDTNSASIVKIIPVTSDDVLIAGTLQHMIVVDRSSNTFERWSLDNFEKELVVKSPYGGVVKAVAAGYASPGPMLVNWAVGTGALDRASYSMVDINNLQAIPGVTGRLHNSSYRDFVHIRAAANGRVFGLWCTSHSPQGMETVFYTGTKLVSKYQHSSVGHIVPGPDGMYVFTGIGGVLSADLNRKNRSSRRRNVPCVPTSHPRFYVSVPTDPGAQVNLGSKPFAGVKPGVHVIGSEAPLINLPSFDLGANSGKRGWARHDFSLDKRVHYIVQSHALISIPFTNDTIIVQKFDLESELQKSGVDYFFVATIPPRGFQPGKKYEYQVRVASKKPRVKFTLATGPDGMKISKSGKLTWAVPKDFSKDSADVIVNLKNSAGQTVYESFTIYKWKEKDTEK